MEYSDQPLSRDVFTVSRLNREVQLLLSTHFPLLWVEGEISNLARPKSGHLYFTLKDPSAQVRCAMFRNRNMYLDFPPENGDQVLIRARIGLYELRGEYQLTVEHMERAGSGALQQAFEALKRRLAAEGLFDEARKRPLPAYPGRVCIVTSPTGAAIRDILSVLRRRFPALPLLIYPVPVQGAEAVPAIVEALDQANRRRECDVVILARGGGSLEDLWAFNDERVARAIARSELPVISGIGHEIDFSIADFAADRRAPTPSAAAELLTPDIRETLAGLSQLRSRLHEHMRTTLEAYAQRLAWLEGRLRRQHPVQRVLQYTQRLDEIEQRLSIALRWLVADRSRRLSALHARIQRQSPALRITEARHRAAQLEARLYGAIRIAIERRHHQCDRLAQALKAYSPQATLERGYAIVLRERDQHIVHSHEDVAPGEAVSIRLARDLLKGQITGWAPADGPQTTDPEGEMAERTG